ncbi:hypothetical protein ACLB2K_017396 [Fragaria x ananassa]
MISNSLTQNDEVANPDPEQIPDLIRNSMLAPIQIEEGDDGDPTMALVAQIHGLFKPKAKAAANQLLKAEAVAHCSNELMNLLKYQWSRLQYYGYTKGDGIFPIDYALFQPLPSVKQIVDPNTLFHYNSMFDAMVDATYYSIDALNFTGIAVVVTESGWPWLGGSNEPDARLFCVAKSEADPDKLEDGLNWACGQGQADCTPIQQGQGCYLPNTLVNHASYAYNDYYQRMQSVGGTCDFGGTAKTTTIDPSYGSCKFAGR